MKRFALILTAASAIALLNTPVMAAHTYYFGGGHGAVHHAQDHARLNHRAQHRAVAHHDAHHYPMTYWQHAGLHYQLNHQATHDAVRHHVAHDSGRYYGGRGHHGFGIRIGGFSFRLGH